MNRWNIDILDINMQEHTRKKILADANLRERLQAEPDGPSLPRVYQLNSSLP